MCVRKELKALKLENLKEIFSDIIERVLRFKLGLDIHEYKNDQLRVNWRDLEDELEIDYPIKATEVKFGKELFSKWRSNNSMEARSLHPL